MATKAVQNTQETVQENTVEEAVETVNETEAAIGEDSVTQGVAVTQEDVQQEVVQESVKPVFEYVRVDTFLPVPLEVGKQAYVRVLGEHDTKEMISTVPVFTQPVIAITEDGFETDDAIYKEI